MNRKFTDQMGRNVEVNFPPRRIVSLVPSQTELLYDLGLSDEVVGQTLFCIHPDEMHRTKPRIGGTKKCDIQKITALSPDLIIGNKEENDQHTIEQLAQKYPVWMSDIQTLTDALVMIQEIGKLVDKDQQAKKLSDAIFQQFDSLAALKQPIRTVYLIWRNPWMAASTHTFIDNVLSKCGLINCVPQPRYPQLTNDELVSLNPELVLLSSEPYPFKQKHIAELRALLPQTTIQLVDGEMFSWYGSRLLKTVPYLTQLMPHLAPTKPLS